MDEGWSETILVQSPNIKKWPVSFCIHWLQKYPFITKWFLLTLVTFDCVYSMYQAFLPGKDSLFFFFFERKTTSKVDTSISFSRTSF
jgi:hypothetical protein